MMWPNPSKWLRRPSGTRNIRFWYGKTRARRPLRTKHELPPGSERILERGRRSTWEALEHDPEAKRRSEGHRFDVQDVHVVSA